MAVFNNILAGAAGSGGAAGYEIERSLRFNEDDSAYLNRTPASAGNRKTWTWSGWVKISEPDSFNRFFTAGNGTTDSTFLGFLIRNNDVFTLEGGSTIYRRTSSVFRDVSAWYHLVVAFDTTQATGDDRIKIYINGVQLTDFATSNNPSPNSDHPINNNVVHDIGANHYGGGLNFNSDFYLADVHFIDGQALAPTDFGEYDDNNVWQPIEYAGTYGTNGFRLSFSDNTSTTTIAEDSSGNNNDWTANNLSVASGAGNDSLVDSPTNGTQTDTGAGGEVVGNYCTWNPIDIDNTTLSNGNLDANVGASASSSAFGTIGVTSGKFYWEVTHTTIVSNTAMVGISAINQPITSRQYLDAYGWFYDSGTGKKFNNGTNSSYGAAWAAGDVIGVALDMDAGSVAFYKNGVSQGTAYSTGLAGNVIAPAIGTGTGTAGQVSSANFGQRAFAYTAPSGFNAINTASLSDPTIADGSTAMDVVTYTGTGSSQAITGLEFSPDFVWIKNRSSGGSSHALFDIVRGADKRLRSNGTDAELSPAIYGTLSSFDSNGFTVAPGSSDDIETCNLNDTYVGWAWDGGTSTVSNTDGSITSSVRANASAGFSIVTWTGDGQSNATVGHGLGVAPSMIITVSRDGSSNWNVFHQSLATNNLLFFTTSAAVNVATNFGGGGIGPGTSTVLNFTQGTSNVGNANANNVRYVAYVFSSVDGYSSFGSYTGNGSADGPFVFTGHASRWIMIKRTDSTGSWIIYDTQRNLYNTMDLQLLANEANAETTTTTGVVDTVSNGFKLRGTGSNTNASGGTYIYAAFAEHPLALNGGLAR